MPEQKNYKKLQKYKIVYNLQAFTPNPSFFIAFRLS